ncbi:MAG: lysine exporter LysO family protein [Bacillota bacterium]
MTISILAAVILGILFGLFLFPQALIAHMGLIIDLGLCMLLFFVGIDIGRNKNIIDQIKDNGLRVLLVPIMVALGSIVGSTIGGVLLGLPFHEASAVGAGFGWYSLSAIELSKYSAQTGALAFITNVSREIIAIISIPFVAKYIGKLEAIGPAGATAMDTALPVISESTDGRTAVISFITGVVLSILVPILVPFLISLG